MRLISLSCLFIAGAVCSRSYSSFDFEIPDEKTPQEKRVDQLHNEVSDMLENITSCLELLEAMPECRSDVVSSFNEMRSKLFELGKVADHKLFPKTSEKVQSPGAVHYPTSSTSSNSSTSSTTSTSSATSTSPSIYSSPRSLSRTKNLRATRIKGPLFPQLPQYPLPVGPSPLATSPTLNSSHNFNSALPSSTTAPFNGISTGFRGQKLVPTGTVYYPISSNASSTLPNSNRPENIVSFNKSTVTNGVAPLAALPKGTFAQSCEQQLAKLKVLAEVVKTERLHEDFCAFVEEINTFWATIDVIQGSIEAMIFTEEVAKLLADVEITILDSNVRLSEAKSRQAISEPSKVLYVSLMIQLFVGPSALWRDAETLMGNEQLMGNMVEIFGRLVEFIEGMPQTPPKVISISLLMTGAAYLMAKCKAEMGENILRFEQLECICVLGNFIMEECGQSKKGLYIPGEN